jgi:hypothetical protein
LRRGGQAGADVLVTLGGIIHVGVTRALRPAIEQSGLKCLPLPTRQPRGDCVDTPDPRGRESAGERRSRVEPSRSGRFDLVRQARLCLTHQRTNPGALIQTGRRRPDVDEKRDELRLDASAAEILAAHAPDEHYPPAEPSTQAVASRSRDERARDFSTGQRSFVTAAVTCACAGEASGFSDRICP